MEKLKCRICNYETARSLVSHITKVHKMDMKKYRNLYPNDIIQYANEPEARKRSIETYKRRFREDKEMRDRYYEGRKKPTSSHWKKEYWIVKFGMSEEEAIKKVSEIQTANKDKYMDTLTDERLRELSKKYSGSANPSSYESVMARHDCTMEEAKSLMPCYGRCGPAHPWFGKKHSEESRQKMLIAATKGSGKSAAEIELFNILLNKYNLDVESNVRKDRYLCDIVFEKNKIIVEYFGDYWHCNPALWEATDYHSMIDKTAEERWKFDKEKVRRLEALGYKVIIVWESDYNRDKQSCIEKILEECRR
jgi:G:T-mismatch repair DNA endonuclease (very short patch repair protein)